MNGYTIGDNGQIMASYSNGQQQLLGRGAGELHQRRRPRLQRQQLLD